MGRRSLGLGEAGTVSVMPYKQDEDGKWKRAANARDAQSWWAMCYIRGQDGVRRQVIRRGRTKLEAQRYMDAEVERAASGGLLTATDPFVKYGQAWLDNAWEIGTESQRKGSLANYKTYWKRIKVSNLRGLTLEQANHPQRLRMCLQSIADNNGPAAMKLARAVLNNILQSAINDGILTTNGVRQLGEIKTQVKSKRRTYDHKRACTREERDALLASAYEQIPATGDKRTIRVAWAVADLLSVLFGLGTRIDEARGLRWDEMDLDKNEIFVHGTKNETSDRLVSAPEWLLERLRARALRSGQAGYVLPSPALKDTEVRWQQSNSADAVRAVLDKAGFEWMPPHCGRRTVASILEKQGVPVSDIADFLGHADQTMTQRHYIGRDFGGSKAHLSALL